jgi:hypothetical protein
LAVGTALRKIPLFLTSDEDSDFKPIEADEVRNDIWFYDRIETSVS